MSKEPWLIEVHDEFDYERFLLRLHPAAAEAVRDEIRERLQAKGIELAGTQAVKALGERLFEYRIARAANAAGGKMLVRIFFTYRKGRVILRLGAYDKLADSSKTKQQKQIAIARERIWR